VPDSNPKYILVVEDEPAIREAVADTLEYEGYHVEMAADGLQALAKVRATRPDAIVLDLMMPIMDGWTFLQHLRQEPSCAATPVLVISAFRNLEETAPSLPVQGWLAKPFDLNVLLGTVAGLV
jgi:two-component system, chemotaxis family, chemotaxis protein CheY